MVYLEMIRKFNLDIEKLRKIETWRDFDEEFTIKTHPKFACAAQYYHEASCLSTVQNVNVPTLVLHSQDDPIVPVDCVPVDECLANPKIITALTKRGGHVCYFMGSDGAKRWYTYACAEFLDSVLKQLETQD